MLTKRMKHFFLLGLCLVVLAGMSNAQVKFNAPDGGWDYVFDGDAAAYDDKAALDGNWNHEDDGGAEMFYDEWDGTAPGEIGSVNPVMNGGVATYDDNGTTFLRIQDVGYLGTNRPNNNEINFDHHGIPDGALDSGITLAFRVRLAVPEQGFPLDTSLISDKDWNNTSQKWWPAGGDGAEIYYGSGMFTLSQSTGTDHLAEQIGFGMQNSEIIYDDSTVLINGLTMSNTAGNTMIARSSDGNSRKAGDCPPRKATYGFLGATTPDGQWGYTNLNTVNVLDPTQWHEYWIHVIADGKIGTHKVTVWVDGKADADTTYYVTSTEQDIKNPNGAPFLRMGTSISNGYSTAYDVDYVAFKIGLFDPTDCAGVVGGSASIDSCGICSGGTTGIDPCQKDCADVWGGDAYLDDCDICVGGTTGLDPCLAHADGVPVTAVLKTDGSGFTLDGVFDEAVFADAAVMNMEREVIVTGDDITDLHAGFFMLAYDDENIYGYAEVTDPEIHAKDEFAVAYDFGDPMFFTNYGWEGDPAIDDDPAIYTRIDKLADNLEQVVDNRGSSWFVTATETGYNVEWKTAIATGVTSNADVVSEMLTRGTFAVDAQFAACSYDQDGGFIDRNYLAWSSDQNDQWTSSENTGIATLIPYTVLQAEGTSCMLDGVDENPDNPHYTGTGFANTDNELGNAASWALESDIDQTIALTIRYAVKNEARSCDIFVNDEQQVDTFACYPGGSWQNWKFETKDIVLKAGQNVVKLVATHEYGLANIDFLAWDASLNVTAADCPFYDCAGVDGGDAFIDECGTCVGGTTGLEACEQDCNGDWGGTAYYDDCEICVGGNTGLEPCVVSVGLNGVEGTWVYPIPTDGRLIVENLNGGSFILFDVQGKEVMNRKVSSDKIELDLSDAAPGIYLMVTTTKDGLVENHKVVK